MKISLLFFVTLLLINPAFSQNKTPGAVTGIQVKNAIHLYNELTADNAPIYNGEAYIFYAFKMEGDPYFKSGDFSKGWVDYQDRKYDSVNILYDISRNQLVVLTPDKISAIVMLNQFIDSFHLLGHTFISLQEDHKQNLYKSGFFDLLYNGHIQLLEKREETLNPKIEGRIVITEFISHNRFYVHKNGLYYLVSNKKDVYRLFEDKKHEIKRMMRKNHIKLRRRNFEEGMIKVTEFYDQLTH